MSPNERPPGEDKRCSGRVFGPLLASHSLALRLGVMNSPALLSQGLEKHLAGDIGVFPLCHTRCFGVFSFAPFPPLSSFPPLCVEGPLEPFLFTCVRLCSLWRCTTPNYPKKLRSSSVWFVPRNV